ncbi:MAG: phospholipase D-like domain-containing protein [Candidatus Hydrogenedentota bacterium]
MGCWVIGLLGADILYSYDVTIGKVYFSVGGDSSGSNFSFNSELNQALITFITSATKSVRLANFNFTDDDPAGSSILDALIERKNAGVTVKVVLDKYSSQGSGASVYNALLNAGISVKLDNESGDPEMHNKFIVIDSDSGDTANGKVALGSANFNDPQFSEDNNNFIIVERCPDLAFNYTKEFDQMFAGTFHTAKSNVKIASSFSVDTGAITIENYFSPYDNNIDKIIDKVDNSITRIYLACYTFGSNDLANALINAGSTRNVKVKIVFDKSQTFDNPSMLQFYNDLLGRTNIEIFLSTKNPYGIMHHKFIIVDNTVITGSANFTVSANEQNDENDVFITGDNQLLSYFILEFAKIFSGSVDTSGITVPSAEAPLQQTTSSKPENCPNPFIAGSGNNVTIRTKDREILHKAEIFDMRGRKIKEIVLPLNTTDRDIKWDGRDNNGNYMANGVYLYKLYVKNVREPLQGKLTLIK